MRLILIAPGRKMPDWVDSGYQEYARRMPAHARLELVPINSARKSEAQINEAIEKAIPAGAYRVALVIQRKAMSTEDLATRLSFWQSQGRDVALLVGGADGLNDALISSADERWSLGPMTLPHTLVRIVIAEQLYRATSIQSGHPYHRC